MDETIQKTKTVGTIHETTYDRKFDIRFDALNKQNNDVNDWKSKVVSNTKQIKGIYRNLIHYNDLY